MCANPWAPTGPDGRPAPGWKTDDPIIAWAIGRTGELLEREHLGDGQASRWPITGSSEGTAICYRSFGGRTCPPRPPSLQNQCGANSLRGCCASQSPTLTPISHPLRCKRTRRGFANRHLRDHQTITDRPAHSFRRRPDGTVWAGGPQSPGRFALSHFTGGSWQTDELPTDDPAVGGELQIQSILRSRDGAIWAAGSELGLLRFDAAQGRWQRVAVVRDGAPIRVVAQFGDGSLWAGGDGLIARSDDNGQTWTEIGAAANGIGSDIGSLVQDSAGRVWAGAYDGGISVYDGTQWRQFQR